MFFHAILISTLAIVCHYQPCMGQRICRNSSLSMNKVEFRFQQEEMLRGTADNFTLLIRLNWTISGVKNDESDGYLVRLIDSPNYKSALPVDDCEASSTHVWIKTDNRSMCAERNETGLQCTTELPTYGKFCACDRYTCPALLSGYPCSGTPELLEEKYRSIPNTRQSIKFNIKFNVAYLFGIYTYYGKFVGRQKRYSVTYNFRCAELVADAFGLSQPEAYQKCCMNGVRSVTAYNITVSDQRPVFKRNANETTVNTTVSWLPPGDGVGVANFFIDVRGISIPKTNPKITAVLMKPVDIVSTVAVNSSSCGMPRFSYEVELYNLQPGINYRIDITTDFKESMVPDLCRHTRCQTTIYMLAQEFGVPTNFQKGELVLDKTTNTINLTISWIPPSSNELMENVRVTVSFLSASPLSGYFPMITKPNIEGTRDGNETYVLDNRRQTSTVYNLLPNTEYGIEVCARGGCLPTEVINTDFDPCNKKWSECDRGFHCVVVHGSEEEITVAATECVLDPSFDFVGSSSSPNAISDSGLDAQQHALVTTVKANSFPMTTSGTGQTATPVLALVLLSGPLLIFVGW